MLETILKLPFPTLTNLIQLLLDRPRLKVDVGLICGQMKMVKVFIWRFYLKLLIQQKQ